MKRAGLLLLIGCCLILAACAAPEPEPPAQEEAAVAAAPSDVVQKAVEIAKAVEADPDSTEQILADHGLTVDEFEQMMFEIGADPEMSKAYEAALAE